MIEEFPPSHEPLSKNPEARMSEKCAFELYLGVGVNYCELESENK